jgi:hypothetical protein
MGLPTTARRYGGSGKQFGVKILRKRDLGINE